MNVKRYLLVALLLCSAFAARAEVKEKIITVNTRRVGALIQSTMWGLFFEDINHGADGGLYAELVKNRSFEFRPNHYTGWDVFGNVELMSDGPFERNPHYVRLRGRGHSEKWTGLQNEGFFGIGLHENAEYRVSVWARVAEGDTATLIVQFINQHSSEERQQFAEQKITISGKRKPRVSASIIMGFFIGSTGILTPVGWTRMRLFEAVNSFDNSVSSSFCSRNR